MEKLLTLQYYFNTRPDPDFQFTKLTLLLVALFFLVGIAIKIYRKKYAKDAIVKKMIKRYPSRLFTFGAILLLLLLVREAGIPIASMRILWIALLVILIVWIVKIGLSFKKEYRYRLRQSKHHATRSKYLPKKK